MRLAGRTSRLGWALPFVALLLASPASALDAPLALASLRPAEEATQRTAPPSQLADGAWSLVNAPAPRSQHVAVWDPVGRRMLVFGGSGGSRLRDVWSYSPDLDRWTPLPTTGPAPDDFSGRTAVWDPVRGQVVLYGGFRSGDDLWVYRPGTNAWSRVIPRGVAPPARTFHSAVWDQRRDRMVVFAGLGAGFGPRNDLWAYGPATNAWVPLLTFRPVPLPLFYHAAVWDPVGDQLLAFGGADPLTGEYIDELWRYSPESGAWAELRTQGDKPPPRLSHTSVWDALGGQMLVYGGGCGAGCFRDDIWSFQPATQSWSKLPWVGPTPSARGGHSGVWDPVGGRLLVFAGSNPQGTLRDLWAFRPGTYTWARLAVERPDFLALSAHRAVWDSARSQMVVLDSGANRLWVYRPADNTWAEPTQPTLAPPSRQDPSALWDPEGRRVLVFGGHGRLGYLDDLWSYDPARNSWALVMPSGPSPPGRFRHAAVWDPIGSQMLVFGGYRDGPLDDLWSYRPSSNSWARLSPSGRIPARFRHSAVWDPAREQMLVYGGSHGDPLTDLWSYRPRANAWNRLDPGGAYPPTHFLHAAVWDQTEDRMLVFGGYGGRRFDELWSYRPSEGSWKALRPWGDPPPARGPHSAVWDPTGARVLVASGYSGGRPNDLWSYRPASNAWTQPGPSPQHPRARQQHTAVWADDRMLVYGGYLGGRDFLDDLWSYRPATRSWLLREGEGPRPLARSGHSAVWDPAGRRMLLFGGNGPDGFLASLWSYHLETNSWRPLAPTPGPLPREDHTAVWDPDGQQMLVYGGSRDGRALGDLWAYRIADDTWVELTPEEGPPPRFRHGAVWDTVARRMLVFGGYGGAFPGGYLNDLWSWEPTTNTWTPLEADCPCPSPRARHSAVWDARGERMFALGGFAGGIDYLSDLWSYEARTNAWRQPSPTGGPPTPRSAHSAVWDSSRGQMLVYGGYGGGVYDELWVYTSSEFLSLEFRGALPP